MCVCVCVCVCVEGYRRDKKEEGCFQIPLSVAAHFPSLSQMQVQIIKTKTIDGYVPPFRGVFHVASEAVRINGPWGPYQVYVKCMWYV